jgi:peptidoglycan/LPS O-acetylase OafA/YrhL
MRFHHLDTLRFIFALYIVWGHAVGWIWFDKNGPLAVDFFFVLSGFVLTHLLHRRRMTYWQFATGRFARIWPLNVLSILPLLLISRSLGPPDVLIANILLLQNSGVLEQMTLNWPSWSVSAEMIIGVAIFYPIAHFRMRSAAFILAGIGFGVLLARPEALTILIDQHLGPLTVGLVRCLLGTLLGYLCYEAYLRFRSRRLPGALFIHSSALGIFLIVLAMPLPRMQMMLVPLVWSGLLLMLTLGDSIVVRALGSPYIRWVGNLSFAIYMIHAPFLILFIHLDVIPPGDAMQAIVNANNLASYSAPLIAYFLTVLICSQLVYALFEMPAKQLIVKAATNVSLIGHKSASQLAGIWLRRRSRRRSVRRIP